MSNAMETAVEFEANLEVAERTRRPLASECPSRRVGTLAVSALDCTVSILAIAVLMIAGSPILVYASDIFPSPPVVSFDTPLVVSCKEIARSEKTKTILATFAFSIRTDSNKFAVLPLDEVSIEIESPDRILRVSDFLPQTTTVTDVVDGEKQVVIRRFEGSASISKLEAAIEAKAGNSQKTTAEIKANGSTESRDSQDTTIDITYKQLAPRELLLASGTLNRGHGVFFKLKRTSQNEIEGQHKFICLFEVVPTWRCDYLQGRCTSWCKSECSKADFVIGVFMDNDSVAKALVENAVTIRERMAPMIVELDSVRNGFWYPWFGAGSKAAEIDRKLSADRDAYNKTIKDTRLTSRSIQNPTFRSTHSPNELPKFGTAVTAGAPTADASGLVVLQVPLRIVNLFV
jgi:hypothetical protein